MTMTAAILAAAMVLDALMGEPRWLWSRLPHPAVLMGRAVGWLDTSLNQGEGKQTKGAFAVFMLCAAAGLLGWIIAALPMGWLWQVLVVAILLAQRSLVQHVGDVARALRLSVFDGRTMVARIVGRDTADMTKPQVARAAIESAAENLSDGVIAPAFWFLIAGLPGILIYKVVNTADSMIGYRTPRHEAFGWASAKLDDVLNWVPARLTGMMIALTHGVIGDWSQIATDARKHRSPNAGWPEAALARALDIALAGPRSYEGTLRQFPFVNHSGAQDIGAAEIDLSIRALWTAWAFFLAVALAVSAFTF